MNTTWTSIPVLGLVAALLAGSAWGQGATTTPSAPPDATKSAPATPEGKTDSKSDAMKSETKPDTMKSEGKPRARANREQVKAAQQALKDKGQDRIDGVMGPKTQAALKAFQKTEGLKTTGRLDSETMAKLGVEAKTSGMEPTSPSASPATGASGDKAPDKQSQ